MILLSSLVSSEQIGYKIIYTDQSMDVNQLFDSLKGEFETISVATCDHTDIEARLDALEVLFNTIQKDFTPEPTYICDTGEEAKCPFGITTLTGKHTRCYTEEGQYWWDAKYCKEDWVLV